MLVRSLGYDEMEWNAYDECTVYRDAEDKMIRHLRTRKDSHRTEVTRSPRPPALAVACSSPTSSPASAAATNIIRA
jgi:hypothetical protein